MKISLKNSWNKISKSYQKEFYVGGWGAKTSTSHPLDSINNVRGKRVIELGSGAAQLSINLSKKGAIATAVDFSENQINHGRRLANRANVEVSFVVGDLNKLNKYFPRQRFDIAFSSYAFQYIGNLDKFFASVNKILKKNGLLVFGLDHPVWTCGKWQKIRGKEMFTINDYFKRRKVFWDWKFKRNVGARFYVHHKTLEDFFRALVKNGFVVEMITEPYPLKSNRRHSENYSFSKMRKVPYTIVFKARKI